MRPDLRILWIGACTALVAGLAEAATHVVHSVIPDDGGFRADTLPHILWIVPAVYLLLFLVIAALLALSSRVLPRRVRADSLALAIFGALGTLAFVTALAGHYSWIVAPWSIAVLCLGVAGFLYSLTSRRPPAAPSALRRDFLRLSALAALVNAAGFILGRDPLQTASRVTSNEVGLGDLLLAPLSRRSLLTAAPAKAATMGANVLLIVLDTLRADRLSAYGYPRATTPHLDRLAAEGVLFESAYSSAPWTLPSHASILTGLHVYEHGATHARMDTGYPTLAEHFTAHGYATGGFVSNLVYTNWGRGVGRGFQVYEDYGLEVLSLPARTALGQQADSGLKTLLDARRTDEERYPMRPARAISQQFIAWQQANAGTPFFGFLNYMEVHQPYNAPASYDERFTDSPPDVDVVTRWAHGNKDRGKKIDVDDIQRNANRYDRALSYLDAELGMLFEQLADVGVLDKTVVILTSDHGEQFGNHGMQYHGNSLYRDLLHVPLIIRHPPTVAAGGRVPSAVTLQSIAATAVSLAGIDAGSPFRGTPMGARWIEQHSGAASEDGFAFSEMAAWKGRSKVERKNDKSLATRTWHLIAGDDGWAELYHVERDPDEHFNLNGTAEGATAVRELGPLLQQFLTADEWERYRRGIGM